MPKIMEMYAFIMKDTGPDDEGVAAMKLGRDYYPMVGADMERVESLRPVAEDMVRLFGKEITIARFTQRTDLETIKP